MIWRLEMLKKIFLSLFVLLLLSSQGHAYESGHSEKNYFKRVFFTEMRGVANILASPVELVRTPLAEGKYHKYLWPITSFPRSFTNVMARITSGVYDVAFSPVFYLFSKDTTPITHPMGLPDYPWQFKEENF